ncbi:unnamed protein product [Fusarium graminearum]|nr:unnamed protein product [Fusarium graminearum]
MHLAIHSCLAELDHSVGRVIALTSIGKHESIKVTRPLQHEISPIINFQVDDILPGQYAGQAVTLNQDLYFVLVHGDRVISPPRNQWLLALIKAEGQRPKSLAGLQPLCNEPRRECQPMLRT